MEMLQDFAPDSIIYARLVGGLEIIYGKVVGVSWTKLNYKGNSQHKQFGVTPWTLNPTSPLKIFVLKLFMAHFGSDLCSGTEEGVITKRVFSPRESLESLRILTSLELTRNGRTIFSTRKGSYFMKRRVFAFWTGFIKRFF